jgi:hypothetical protein
VKKRHKNWYPGFWLWINTIKNTKFGDFLYFLKHHLGKLKTKDPVTFYFWTFINVQFYFLRKGFPPKYHFFPSKA